VEIDQSGKIEKTNKPTAVAFSDSQMGGSVLVPQEVKKLAFTYLEERFGRDKINIIRIFAASTVVLLRAYNLKVASLIIDREYPGYDPILKNLIVDYGRKLGLQLDAEDISIQEIGKKSEAHWLAYDVFTKKKKAGRTIQLRDLLKVLP
jgi:hypothetical protein